MLAVGQSAKMLNKDEARRIAQITKAISIADIKMIAKATKAISTRSTLRILSPQSAQQWLKWRLGQQCGT